MYYVASMLVNPLYFEFQRWYSITCVPNFELHSVSLLTATVTFVKYWILSMITLYLFLTNEKTTVENLNYHIMFYSNEKDGQLCHILDFWAVAFFFYFFLYLSFYLCSLIFFLCHAHNFLSELTYTVRFDDRILSRN